MKELVKECGNAAMNSHLHMEKFAMHLFSLALVSK